MQLSREYNPAPMAPASQMLEEMYRSHELHDEGLLSFEYPLYVATDEELDHFLGKLVRSVSRAASGAAKTVGSVAKTVGKGISAVEKVVPSHLLTAGLGWTPAGMAIRAGMGAMKSAANGQNVFQGAMRSLAADPVSRFYVDTGMAAARGENILKAAQKAAQAGIGDLRQSLQFAAMVAPFIPGIGTGVAAALSAANALAAGQPITEALIAAARGAVPGGAVAQMAFDTAVSLAKGKNISAALLDSARSRLPGGPAAQAAFDSAVALAKGKSIQDAAFAAAGRFLPPSPYAGNALAFVKKVASGENIQRAALSQAGNVILNKIQQQGGPALPHFAGSLQSAAARRQLPTSYPWPRGIRRELSEWNFEEGTPIPCPASTSAVIRGWGQYSDSLAGLPLAERNKIDELAEIVVASFRTGCQPLGLIGIVGHADMDFHGAAKELEVSQQRAISVSAALATAIMQVWRSRGMGPFRRGAIAFLPSPHGVGATIPDPSNIPIVKNRLLNRRVVITLRPRGTPISPPVKDDLETRIRRVLKVLESNRVTPDPTGKRTQRAKCILGKLLNKGTLDVFVDGTASNQKVGKHVVGQTLCDWPGNYDPPPLADADFRKFLGTVTSIVKGPGFSVRQPDAVVLRLLSQVILMINQGIVKVQQYITRMSSDFGYTGDRTRARLNLIFSDHLDDPTSIYSCYKDFHGGE